MQAGPCGETQTLKLVLDMALPAINMFLITFLAHRRVKADRREKEIAGNLKRELERELDQTLKSNGIYRRHD
jgi:hypothetical protein